MLLLSFQPNYCWAPTDFQFLLGCFVCMLFKTTICRYWLSIPSRMLLQSFGYDPTKMEVSFQFLLGCFCNSKITRRRIRKRKLSIPSRMLHLFAHARPRRIRNFFQFLLGCFLIFYMAIGHLFLGSFQFLLGCFSPSG